MFYQDPFDVIIIGGVMQALRPQCRSAYGSTNPAFDTQYRHAGANELQPGDWRHWERTPGKEVDALGGLMAKAIDQAGIQFEDTKRQQRTGSTRHPRPG